MSMFKKFQVKDIVWLAVISAAMTLAGGCTMPLVMHTSLFGLRNMVAAPLYALFATIGLMKVRKPGALSIIGLFTGAPLVFFAPIMFFNNFVGAVIAEILVLIIWRGYTKNFAVVFGSAVWMIMTVPLTIVFHMWMNDVTFSELIGTPAVAIGTSIGTVVLGFAGGFIGLKIAKELQKAGKLKENV